MSCNNSAEGQVNRASDQLLGAMSRLLPYEHGETIRLMPFLPTSNISSDFKYKVPSDGQLDKPIAKPFPFAVLC